MTKPLLLGISFLGLAFACGGATPALAYDKLSGPWDGGYIGAYVGGASADYRHGDCNCYPGPTGSSTGFVGGVDLGVNIQAGRIVFGAEADGGGFFLEKNSAALNFSENWTAMLRARLGVDLTYVMPYVTAGGALTGVETQTPGGRSHGYTAAGYVVGGGLDMALASRWIGRVEYLYVDVPVRNSTVNGVTVAGGSHNSILRVGANYRF